jgi:hypothetical protein
MSTRSEINKITSTGDILGRLKIHGDFVQEYKENIFKLQHFEGYVPNVEKNFFFGAKS